jgi:hypothetical protein
MLRSHQFLTFKGKVSKLYILSRVWVNVDGVWICDWIYWLLYHSWHLIIAPSLISTIYKSLQNTLFLVCCLHQSFPGNGKSSESGQCSYSVCSLLFRFGGGRLLHNVQTYIFRGLMEIPTVCLVIFSTTVWLLVLLSVLLLLRRNSSFRPRLLVPLLHSSYSRRLLPSVHPFEVPLATLSLPGPWRPCPLRCAVMARRVILLRMAVSVFRDPPSPWVPFFSCWRRPTARCLSPYRSFSALTIFSRPLLEGLPPAPLRTLISTEAGSLLSRQTSIASW